MDPRINVVTLGVKDINKSRKFYESGLGWKASNSSTKEFAAFHMSGTVLSLYLIDLLAQDATQHSTPQGFRGVTLAQNVRSKEEVDTVLRQAVSAGATLIKPAQEVFWGGYSGYFADPDGHLWEIAWNPHWKLLEDGTLELP